MCKSKSSFLRVQCADDACRLFAKHTWNELALFADEKIPWPRYTTRIVQKKSPISDDLGLRSPVIQRTFRAKSAATSIVARVVFFVYRGHGISSPR